MRPADRGRAGARHGEVDDPHRGVHRGMHLAQHAPDGGLRHGAEDPAGASSGDGLGPRPAGPGRQPVRAERGESLAHPDRDADRRAGAGSAATPGRVAGGDDADRAWAVRLRAGPGLPARRPRPEAVWPGAGRRRLVPDRVRAAADLCVPGPRPVAALADGGPALPPDQAAARAQAMVVPAAPAGGRGGYRAGRPGLRVQPRLGEPPVEPGRDGGRIPHCVVVPGRRSGSGSGRADSPGALRDRGRPVLAVRAVRHVSRHAEIRRRAGQQPDLGRRGGSRRRPDAGLRALARAPHGHPARTRPAAARTRRRPGRAGGAADPDPGRRGGQRRGRAAAGGTGRRPGWSPWA
jgi:hypothetical protein